MLKGIDPVFSPDLLAALARMGHADKLAVVDLNFPAYAPGKPVVHTTGLSAPQFLAKLGTLFPIDDYVPTPVSFMQDPDAGADGMNEVHREFVAEARRLESPELGAAAVERYEFYRRCKEVSLVITTEEYRPYGCFIVDKGVVRFS